MWYSNKRLSNNNICFINELRRSKAQSACFPRPTENQVPFANAQTGKFTSSKYQSKRYVHIESNSPLYLKIKLDESKMIEVGFSRKDLSLILKYLFYKEEMQLSDRNLLRRILISTFEEEIICAGTKKFIHFLRWDWYDEGFSKEKADYSAKPPINCISY